MIIILNFIFQNLGPTPSIEKRGQLSPKTRLLYNSFEQSTTTDLVMYQTSPKHGLCKLEAKWFKRRNYVKRTNEVNEATPSKFLIKKLKVVILSQFSLCPQGGSSAQKINKKVKIFISNLQSSTSTKSIQSNNTRTCSDVILFSLTFLEQCYLP